MDHTASLIDFIYIHISDLPGCVTIPLMDSLPIKKTYDLKPKAESESKAQGKLVLGHTFVEEEALTQRNVVEVLLDKGANINEKNNDGDTQRPCR